MFYVNLRLNPNKFYKIKCEALYSDRMQEFWEGMQRWRLPNYGFNEKQQISDSREQLGKYSISHIANHRVWNY